MYLSIDISYMCIHIALYVYTHTIYMYIYHIHMHIYMYRHIHNIHKYFCMCGQAVVKLVIFFCYFFKKFWLLVLCAFVVCCSLFADHCCTYKFIYIHLHTSVHVHVCTQMQIHAYLLDHIFSSLFTFIYI